MNFTRSHKLKLGKCDPSFLTLLTAWLLHFGQAVDRITQFGADQYTMSCDILDENIIHVVLYAVKVLNTLASTLVRAHVLTVYLPKKVLGNIR